MNLKFLLFLSFIAAQNQCSSTPLHRIQNLKEAQKLIDDGADVNAKDKFGHTPLHTATSPEMVQLLIKNGADVNARNVFGDTPLHTKTSPEIVRLLIKNGADVNARNKVGATPLNYLSKELEKAELLIDNGADVNARDENDNTPLHRTNTSKIARYFIAKGADVNAKNVKGEKPLIMTYYKEFDNTTREESPLDSELIPSDNFPPAWYSIPFPSTTIPKYGNLTQKGRDLFFNLKAEFFNLDNSDHKLSTMIIKEMYIDYLNGNPLMLESFLLDTEPTSMPSFKEEIFTHEFITKVRNERRQRRQREQQEQQDFIREYPFARGTQRRDYAL